MEALEHTVAPGFLSSDSRPQSEHINSSVFRTAKWAALEALANQKSCHTCFAFKSWSSAGDSSLCVPITTIPTWDLDSRAVTVSNTCSPGWTLSLLQFRDTWGKQAHGQSQACPGEFINKFLHNKTKYSDWTIKLQVHSCAGWSACELRHWWPLR